MILINLVAQDVVKRWGFCRHADLGVLERYADGRCRLCCNQHRARERAKNPIPARQSNLNSRARTIDRVRERDRARYAASAERRAKHKDSSDKFRGVVWPEGLNRDVLLERQQGLCANSRCGQILASLPPKQVHVDHDHAVTDGSPNVRGILCHRCNCVEGLLRGDAAVAVGLIEYTQRGVL